LEKIGLDLIIYRVRRPNQNRAPSLINIFAGPRKLPTCNLR